MRLEDVVCAGKGFFRSPALHEKRLHEDIEVPMQGLSVNDVLRV